MDAIILVNKHSGPTSNRLLQKVKHLFNVKKAGYAGALDPLATGMLPICFNKATRINQFLLTEDKCYQATIKLGTITDSGDIDGKVISSKAPPIFDTQQIKAVLKTFVGSSLQKPPRFSALKHQGKPLYYYARKGITINKAPRQAT